MTWTMFATPVMPIPSIRMNWLACSAVDSSTNTSQSSPASIGCVTPRKCIVRPR